MIMPPQQQLKNRQFICPCSKAYYSYAALFTHIKQKHNGKAPGQIIKPQPQNKRGRPRKVACESPEKRWKENGSAADENQGLMANTINLNHVNTNLKIVPSSSSLVSTPGSQFKHYKAGCTQILTNNQIQTETHSQSSLLQHFTNSLSENQSNLISKEVLQQIQVYKIYIHKGFKSEMLQCIEFFIEFCRQSLKDQIVSQIELLMIILLQHVYQSRSRQSFEGLKHIVLNSFIDSFFEKMSIYTNKWRLEEQTIFEGLNPMKILVVYYNWINNIYNSDNDVSSFEDKSISQ